MRHGMKYAIRAGKVIHLLKPVSHCIYKCFYNRELALDCYSIQNISSSNLLPLERARPSRKQNRKLLRTCVPSYAYCMLACKLFQVL